VIDILNFVLGAVTLYFGYHIAETLDSKKKDGEHMFNYSLSKLENFKEASKILLDYLSTGTLSHKEIISKLKSLSVCYESINHSLRITNRDIPDHERKEIGKYIFHIRCLCTEVQKYDFNDRTIKYDGTGDLKLEKVLNGTNVFINGTRLDEIRDYLNKLSDKLFITILDLREI